MATLRPSIFAALVIAGVASRSGGQATTPSGATGKFTAAQYKKALWMATRYFGAMRSGEGPNWVLQDSDHPKSFVKDSIPGYNVSGGWYDCGDHVMFGQTQFYAAYLLAKAYVTFPTGFPDLYTGDYSDYKAKRSYTIADGSPNGIADILEELRYEADFFVKATPTADIFVYQKGMGKYDHQNWVDAGFMSTLPVSKGGESDGSRPVFTNPQDGAMPAYCAAMLAIMARVDPDPARSAQYLAHAKNAYQYAQKNSGTAPSYPGDDAPYYAAIGNNGIGGNAEVVAAKVCAATELYLTTKDASYQIAATSNAQSVYFNGYYSLDWANPSFMGMYNAKFVLGSSSCGRNDNNDCDINAYLAGARGSVNSGNNNVTTYKQNAFALRGPETYSYLQALVQAKSNDFSNDQFILNQVDYILGANSRNQTYLVGWDEGGKSQPGVLQSRNYYMNEDVSKSQTTDQPPPAKNKYFGAVVPGALDGSYTNNIDTYNQTEACLEQNAPFVGALGYVLSRVAPVDTANMAMVAVHPRAATEFSFSARAEGHSLLISSSSPLEDVSVTDLQGRTLMESSPGTTSFRWSAKRPGLYLARVRTAAGWASSKVLVQ